MRYRPIACALLAVTMLVAACGDDDDSAADSTTTTTVDGPSTSAPPVANARILAKLMVQIDDHLRSLMRTADPCIHGPFPRCAGTALEAYQHIDDDANGVAFALEGSTNPDSDIYAGELGDDAVALFDASITAGAAAKAASEAAQEACLPDFPDGCAEANDALRTSLDDLLKLFNDWRDHLTDPA